MQISSSYVTDYRQFLLDKKNEVYRKLKNGDTETSYQTGAQSFTQKEWDKLLTEFDDAQEAVRKMMREEQEKKAEERMKKDHLDLMESGAIRNDGRIAEGRWCKTTTELAENSTGAVTVADSEDEGEFLGITMVPEEGKSVVYGMRAVLSEKSTPTNPIVQVISNLGGKKEIYNVEVNKVDPQNASQLEMFALLSYSDKMGLTDGGTFGSYQQLEVYTKNASRNGYCGDMNGGAVFLNEKFDWPDIIERMMLDYLETEINNQYEDCKNLLSYFDTITVEKQTEEASGVVPEEFAGKYFWELMNSGGAMKNKIPVVNQFEKDKVIEKSVVSLPSGVSLHFNESTGEVSCVDDKNGLPGRQYLWSKKLSKEEFTRSDELLKRHPYEGHWEYQYGKYLSQEDFWDKYLNNEIDLDTLI